MRVGNTYCVGVTGVIGSGKSTLCRFLHDRYGFHWIDADEITHELYRNGAHGYKKIAEYFGLYYVGKKGVHRVRLRKLVLRSPQKIWILNKLMHPLVSHEVNKKIAQLKREQNGRGTSFDVLRICIEAVYFEPGDLGKFADEIITVQAAEKNIIRRLESRGLEIGDIKKLYKFQKRALTPKGGACTLSIQNDGTRPSFFERAHRLLKADMIK